jgi:hypothetical protein
MIRYEGAQFEYEPYPIGVIAPAFDQQVYKELSEDFPPLSLFRHRPDLGNKYALSELNRPEKFRRFLTTSDIWGRFGRYIKSREFVEQTLDALKARHIDLAIGRYKVVSKKSGTKASALSLLRRITELSARFEFSVLSGQGGHVRPHTDDRQKIITLVLSMIRPGEWDSTWGGSTAIVWPNDKTRSFNWCNKMIALEDVDFIRHLPFNPNQAVIFVKTFNSWHAVAPITSPMEQALRKTVTVVIERKV